MSMECRQLNVGNLESCARDFSESGKQPPGSARIWSHAGPDFTEIVAVQLTDSL
jgi:hypothetical protein